MHLRRLNRWMVLFVISLVASCGLLPDFGKDSMSSADKAQLNLQMGVRYMEMGMLDVAKEKLEQSASDDSKNTDIQNALAVFYERIKNDEEAKDHYESALNQDPDNFVTQNNFGHFLCERGDFTKGMKLLQDALNSPMNNRTWMALTNMGVCLIRQNDSLKAEGYFRQALQVNPEYAPALQEMQKISYHHQQFMSARAFLERYLSVSKHTAETLWFAFQTERALGNAQAADDYKQQLLTLFPASKEAFDVKTAISK
ncbi:MAG: type pilus biosis/stability protein PilW [Pseudomonadota bacterium]